MADYCGIGSRETPKDMLDLMTAYDLVAAKQGLTLRSGGADGADTAFERGCDLGGGSKIIYIPWNGFNGRRKHERGVTCGYTTAAEAMASRYHPNWSACSQGARGLHARNCYQVLGVTLADPVTHVVCWTKGGSGKGGTGQAIRLAHDNGIPVFDMGAPHIADYIRHAIHEVLK